MLHSLAKINLTALAHNIEMVREHLSRGVKILFAVKSDTYRRCGNGLRAVRIREL
jgi:alanine racemase